jgi:two-component system, NarL family, response regulator NreC
MARFTKEQVDVMLVDRRAVVREGLRALIDHEPDLVVVAEAAAVRDAGTIDVTPDVIVTDIDLTDAKHGDVISGLREFFQHSSILVFTPIGRPATVQSVLDAGAAGYLLETAATIDLLTGIRAVARGETYLQSALGVELARWHRPSTTRPELSPKEQQVLRLLAVGHTNAEVARLCGLSLRTIEKHRARLHQKLGRRTRAELVQYAREVGLLPLGPE